MGSDRLSSPVEVVGAGPCGLAAAIALKQAGIAAVVFEQGCLVSSISQYPTYITFFSSADRIFIENGRDHGGLIAAALG